jgi:hypothetical protein
LPTAALSSEGGAVGIALANSDVVGRLALLAQGLVGSGDVWRGVSLNVSWRGTRPEIGGSVFLARADEGVLGTPVRAGPVTVTEIRGGDVRAVFSRASDAALLRASGGASLMGVRPGAGGRDESFSRAIGFAEAGISARQIGDDVSLTEAISIHGTAGRDIDAQSFRRGRVSGAFQVGGRRVLPLDFAAVYGRVSPRNSSFERFLIGGLPPTLIDSSLLSQVIPMPALPAAVASGSEVFTYRAATRFGLLAPFYWGASTRESAGGFAQWHRVYGAELLLDQVPLPVLGTPGARLSAGIARSLDAPVAGATRGYLIVALRP